MSDQKRLSDDVGKLAAQVGDLGRPARAMAEMPKFDLPRVKSPAQVAFERLCTQITIFEKNLGEGEEPGIVMMSNFGQGLTVRAKSIAFHNPLVIFDGTIDGRRDASDLIQHGDRCTQIQHIGQVSVLLVALKANDPNMPTRIGFQTAEESPEKADAEPTAERP
jgi:hypothetical protein